eukprot:1151337-Pelagomonas_calceolata.AAC.5
MGDTVCRWGAWACPFSIPVSKQKRRGMLVCIHRVPIGNTRVWGVLPLTLRGNALRNVPAPIYFLGCNVKEMQARKDSNEEGRLEKKQTSPPGLFANTLLHNTLCPPVVGNSSSK